MPDPFMLARPLASMWAPFLTMVCGMLGIGLQLQFVPVWIFCTVIIGYCYTVGEG